MDILLSILTPTWNRERNLAELLAVLLPQVAAHPEVDLTVSNNGSADGTKALLARLEGLPRVRVFNQPTNLGATPHIAWLHGQAKGTYLWLLSDDDLVTPDAVAFVCATLRAHPHLGWIHLPHIYLVSGGEPSHTRKPEKDAFHGRGRTAFAPYINWISFITSNVIRTELIHQHLPRVQWGTDFWPMGLLMDAVADEPAFIPARCLVMAGAEVTWADRRVQIMICHYPEEILKSRVLSRSEKAACLLQKYRDTPNQLGRLILIRPSLFCRLLWLQPRLIGILLRPSELAKVFRPSVWKKTWHRLVRRQGASEGMFSG